jgi:Porphobilinogen deaminase
MRKVAAGEFDAILLAEAGLVRLGHVMEEPVEIDGVTLHFEPLSESNFLPAAGQGAIGFEIRAGDEIAREAVGAINDGPTRVRVTAEREFLRLLDGGCHTPVGVWSRLEGGILTMAGRVFPEEGGAPREGGAAGEEPLAVARELFESLI